jgi:hypothetical protein
LAATLRVNTAGRATRPTGTMQRACGAIVGLAGLREAGAREKKKKAQKMSLGQRHNLKRGRSRKNSPA